MQRQQLSHRPRSHVSAPHTKRAVVGNTAGTVPPAWRTNAAASQDRLVRPQGDIHNTKNGHGPDRRRDHRLPLVGSKIIMSQLPVETVHERDIEELFAETVGPVFSVFIIYNSHGKSKGMAVVHFQRSGDAAEARRKYNGKIIDGRRPLKIELIIDPPEAPAKEKSLAERLGGSLTSVNTGPNFRARKFPGTQNPATNVRLQGPRRNLKKGPRRLKKSVEQLDREMEAYMAEAPPITHADISAAVSNGSVM